MPTVINNPTPVQTDSGVGTGLIVGIIVAIVLLGAAFWVFGRPMLYGGVPQNQDNSQTQAPTQDQQKQIDVNGQVKY